MEGTVYWITGPSGSGKTTLGKHLYEHLKAQQVNALFLDGDTLREVFGQDLGYSLEERRKCAMRYSRLCKLLSDQGATVVCATISLFHDCQDWNRKHIPRYREIFVRVPEEVLRQRSSKKLYGEKDAEMVGVGLPMEVPRSPDLTLENDSEADLAKLQERLVKFATQTQRPTGS